MTSLETQAVPVQGDRATYRQGCAVKEHLTIGDVLAFQNCLLLLGERPVVSPVTSPLYYLLLEGMLAKSHDCFYRHSIQKYNNFPYSAVIASANVGCLVPLQLDSFGILSVLVRKLAHAMLWVVNFPALAHHTLWGAPFIAPPGRGRSHLPFPLPPLQHPPPRTHSPSAPEQPIHYLDFFIVSRHSLLAPLHISRPSLFFILAPPFSLCNPSLFQISHLPFLHSFRCSFSTSTPPRTSKVIKTISKLFKA